MTIKKKNYEDMRGFVNEGDRGRFVQNEEALATMHSPENEITALQPLNDGNF